MRRPASPDEPSERPPAPSRPPGALPTGGAGWLDDLRRDVRHGLVALRRTPEFTAVALITLAVGIGANAAMFSVVNAALLRPLGYRAPDRLVRIYETFPPEAGRGSVSVPNLRDWREQARSFQGLAAYLVGSRNLQGSGEPERRVSVAGTADLFDVLGVPPLLGRTFAPGEDQPGRSPVVVIGEGLWRRRFGADPDVLSRALLLDGQPHDVIGVMPSSFRFPPGPTPADVWVPFVPNAEQTASRGNHFLNVLARLAPGTSLEDASAEMRRVAASIEAANPAEQTGRSTQVVPLRDAVVGSVQPALLMLLAAVGLLLLIACANLANLHLARAATRRRDVAVRSALGASRWRLVRQHLTESLLLSLCGAALGAGLAFAALRALGPLVAPAVALPEDVAMDGRVLLFLLAVAVASGVAFGLVPALQAGRGLRDELATSAARTTAGASQQRLRDGLVVAQITLSIVLLIAAGLTLRGFLRLHQTSTGLKAGGALTLRLALLPEAYADGALDDQLLQPVLDEVRAVPGVVSAGLISHLPLQTWGTNGDYYVDGTPPPAPGKAPLAELRMASPGYFSALGIPLLAGRDFSETDGESGGRVAIVNRALALRHFPGEAALGRRLRRDDEDAVYTIVGVVGDVRQGGLDRAPMPEITFPYGDPESAWFLREVTVVVRTAVPTSSVVTPVRAAIGRVAPEQPVHTLRTMEEVVESSLRGRRLALWLIGGFAGVALVLSAAGLYGVVSCLVATRTRELGIRMALGADRVAVLGLVLRRGAALVAIGAAAGLAAALFASSLLRGWLYNVGPRDPLTFAGVVALLAGVALLATLVPALRAASVSPVRALRVE